MRSIGRISILTLALVVTAFVFEAAAANIDKKGTITGFYFNGIGGNTQYDGKLILRMHFDDGTDDPLYIVPLYIPAEETAFILSCFTSGRKVIVTYDGNETGPKNSHRVWAIYSDGFTY